VVVGEEVVDSVVGEDEVGEEDAVHQDVVVVDIEVDSVDGDEEGFVDGEEVVTIRTTKPPKSRRSSGTMIP
jgi:hypothetical protein